MAKAETIEIVELQQEYLTLWVVGKTPLIFNRMSQKAKGELVAPRGRKGAAIRAASMKHDPMAEFRASPYRLSDPQAPTLLALPSATFKGSMKTAALDIPGATKAQIGRMVWVEGEMTPVFGIPQLFMAVTRSADINRTPDVRTRALLPRWAAQVTVSFTPPIIKANSVANLLSAAGFLAGVGDWRPEKGSGNYGQFKLSNADDPALREILATGGRQAQIEAMAAPLAHDEETAELLEWVYSEAKSRGMTVTHETDEDAEMVFAGLNGASDDDEDE